MAKGKATTAVVLKKKKRKGIAKKHTNKHSSGKKYVGQGRF